MKRGSSLSAISSTRPQLRLNEEAPELSSGLSSYRATAEQVIRPLFNNPMLDNEQFLIMLRNLVALLLRYERNNLPEEHSAILKIMRRYNETRKSRSGKCQ